MQTLGNYISEGVAGWYLKCPIKRHFVDEPTNKDLILISKKITKTLQATFSRIKQWEFIEDDELNDLWLEFESNIDNFDTLAKCTDFTKFKKDYGIDSWETMVDIFDNYLEELYNMGDRRIFLRGKQYKFCSFN